MSSYEQIPACMGASPRQDPLRREGPRAHFALSRALCTRTARAGDQNLQARGRRGKQDTGGWSLCTSRSLRRALLCPSSFLLALGLVAGAGSSLRDHAPRQAPSLRGLLVLRGGGRPCKKPPEPQACAAPRGGEPEPETACGAQEENEAAILQSVGETVCVAEGKQRAQLRDRLVHRVALDDSDEVHLAALRADPTNVDAIKAHAAALVPASAHPGEGWSYAATSVHPGADVAGMSTQEKAAVGGTEEVVPLPDAGNTHLRDDAAKYTPVVVGREGAAGEDSGSIRAALAVDLYRYALMLHPADPDAWLALAHLHLATNAFAHGPAQGAGAASSAQPSCQMPGQEVQDPGWSGVGHEAGRGAQDSGTRAVNTVAAARAMMDMAVKLDPTHAPALLARGNLQREAEHDLLGSRVSLLQALQSLEAQRRPGQAGDKRRSICKVLTSLGLTAEAREDETEAEVRYRAALAAWAQDGSAALLLALLLHAQGRGEEAKAVLRGATPLCKAASPTHAAVHYNLALMIMEGSDVSDADVLESLQLLREAVRLAPTDLDMRAKLAWLLFVTDEDAEGAEEKLLEVLAVDPAHASGLVCVSRVMQERGRDLELHLQPLLARAIELKPDDGLLRREHARLLEMLDDLAGAQDELRRARALQPSDANTLLSLARLLAFSHTRPDADDETFAQEVPTQEQEQEQGEQEGQALRAWFRARLRPSPAADPLCALSPDDAPEEDSEDQGPEGVGRRAVEERVSYSSPDQDQGQAPVDLAFQRAASEGFYGQRMKRTVFQDLEEARQLLDEALVLDPHCSEALTVRGHLLAGRHTALYEPQMAVASFRRALALSPGDVEALSALGDVLLRVGDVQEGLAAWQGAIDVAPRDADLRYNLACVLSTLQDSSAPHHTKHLPDRPPPLSDLDCALLAKNTWFSVLSLDPSHVQVSPSCAPSLQPSLQPPLPLSLLLPLLSPLSHNLSLQLSSKGERKAGQARYNLAMVAVAEEDDETAEEHLRAILGQHPDHAPSLYHCARLVEKRGAVNEAIAIFDTLVNSNQRGFSFADAAARLARLLAQASASIFIARKILHA